MFVIKSFMYNGLFAIIFSIFMSSVYASDLVNAEWLNQNNEKITIIDLRSNDTYQTGHIPNAINIPYKEFSRVKNKVNGFVETPAVFKGIMEQYGIKNTDTVVLYSDWSFLDSMRVYWVMDFYGHKHIKVLDGGIQAWEELNNSLTFEVPVIKKSHYVIEINSDIISTKFQTFMASKNSNYVLIDGREQMQFQGKKSLTQRKGHIPNAINIPWIELLKNREESDNYSILEAPSTLQDIDTLKRKLSVIPKDKKIILYCNGGQESAVLYFSLKELGRQAAVYDGSWFEWSTDNKMPIIDLGNQ